MMNCYSWESNKSIFQAAGSQFGHEVLISWDYLQFGFFSFQSQQTSFLATSDLLFLIFFSFIFYSLILK